MSERPILFSAPMVLALLAGTKTQTRRLVKNAEHVLYWRRGEQDPKRWVGCDGLPMGHIYCPYGEPGDRLWVKEKWGYRGSGWASAKPTVRDVHIVYAADETKRTIVRPAKDDSGIPKQHVPKKFADVRRASECLTDEQFALSCEYDEWMSRWWKLWRPSIFMPRWASRLALEVTDVRVERLQDITEADAKAEGVTPVVHESWTAYDPLTDGYPSFSVEPSAEMVARDKLENVRHHGPKVIATAVEQYRNLWGSINGYDSWAKNPWVWVVTFKRLDA